MRKLRGMIRGFTWALVIISCFLAAGQYFAIDALEKAAVHLAGALDTQAALASLLDQTRLILLVTLGILGFVMVAMMLYVAAGYQRNKNAWTEHYTEVAAKDQELAMERDRLDSVYEDLRRMGALTPRVGMHNQSSVVFWLDSNYESFQRANVENLLDGERSTALLFLGLDDVEGLYSRDQISVDAILSEMGDQLELWIRQNDVVARWQDASFLLVLTYITLKDALVRAEDFRAALVENALNVHGVDVNVSVSCGLSLMLSSDSSWRQAMERAKKALSRRKERGANKLYHEIL
ncbi:MAG: diguanylate cyclase [Clostridia bacterium]|nr:diguanylate cyclase [Clostridia bacterium]